RGACEADQAGAVTDRQSAVRPSASVLTTPCGNVGVQPVFERAGVQLFFQGWEVLHAINPFWSDLVRSVTNPTALTEPNSLEPMKLPPVGTPGLFAPLPVDVIQILSEFELVLVDFQRLDPGLEGRWRNSKLRRCPGRSGTPASSLSQRRLDDFPFASRLNIRRRRR